MIFNDKNQVKHNLVYDNDWLDEYVFKIAQWHYDRDLIKGANDNAQYTKLLEEVDELGQSIEAGTSPIDDIGDIIVVLINIAERNNLSLVQCVEHAYNEIKDRKGKMVDGMFVKGAK